MRSPRLRVLIVASWYPDSSSPVGGVFIRDQVEILRRDYDVAVLVPGNLTTLARHPDRLWRRHEAGPEGIPVYRSVFLHPLPSAPGALGKLASWLESRAVNDLLAGWGAPDLIHAHVVWPGGFMAAHLSDRLAVPVLLTEHTGPFSKHLGTPARRDRVARTLDRMTGITAVSPALRDQMLAFRPSLSIEVLGNVVRTDLFVPSAREIPDEPFRLVCVALVHEAKGIQHLLEALRILEARGLDGIELTLCGDGPYRSRLERLARRLGVEHRCRFLGLLTRQEVIEQLNQSHAFVLPSLGETFGISVAEAMACGKPVIATRCGGPEWVVEDGTGLLVEPGAAEPLADQIERLLRGDVTLDSSRIRPMIERRFGPRAFLDQISNLYGRHLPPETDSPTTKSQNAR